MGISHLQNKTSPEITKEFLNIIYNEYKLNKRNLKNICNDYPEYKYTTIYNRIKKIEAKKTKENL